jgi:hypothetical protein
MSLTILRTSVGNDSLLIFGFALFAVGIAAIKMLSIWFRAFWSSTTKAEKKFQKLQYRPSGAQA